ncbi:MAG: RNA 2',3'-cyclic phosphodiesterase [Candidatus Aureabacteria bacterium]|nr:RNA 2',3'-cyclic phosphodiesterase [Candidatus Auribacterota bacterium]
MVRLFVGIDFPEEIKEKLSELCCGVPGAKWVEKPQMHLTLRFIGETDGGTFKEILDSLADVDIPPFLVTLKGIGYFPPHKEPNVLWAGIEKNEMLLRLKNKIDRVLVQLGLEPESRKFTPHVTLARLKDTPIPRLIRYMGEHSLFKIPQIPVNDFVLFSSVLSPKGAIHLMEAAYSLVDSE